jgi:hypothetical protein
VLALVIILVTTNVATIVAFAVFMRRHTTDSHGDSPHDPRVTELLAAASPNSAGSRTRRIISVEILNPLELAGVRGRVFGIAGSFVPHLTRRIVYDQTVRQLREQLAAHHVVADVRVHVLPPDRGETSAASQPIRLDVTMDEEDVLEPDPAYDPPVQ